MSCDREISEELWWDFTTQSLKPGVDLSHLQSVLAEESLDLHDSIAALTQVCSSSRPTSIIRIGDIEALFLLLPFLSEALRDTLRVHLWHCGIDPNHLPDPAELAAAIHTADHVMVQPPIYGCPSFWVPTLDALLQWNLLPRQSRFLDVHAIYYAAHDGLLFKDLTNKKVALVGSKANQFYENFYQDIEYQKRFPQLNLDNFELIAIETPRMYCMNFMNGVVKRVRASYADNIDVYLFSCGVLAKYLSVMVKNENGCSGWDIGGTLDIMMGLMKDRGHLCGPFLEYQHPSFEPNIDS